MFRFNPAQRVIILVILFSLLLSAISIACDDPVAANAYAHATAVAEQTAVAAQKTAVAGANVDN